MRVVTTCHKAGFEEYGHRLLETWHHWPKGTELWWYTEGFSLPKDKPDGIVEISTDTLWGLEAFKTKYAKYVSPNYLYDVVRFSNKVYAVTSALAGYTGIGVWMDADCVTRKDIPDGFIEGHLQKAYIALFKRKGMYSETGFWIMDCSHMNHTEFLDAWCQWYEESLFKKLSNWTDCETLDATIRFFEKQNGITSISLSGDFEKVMHPMSKVELGRYIDHCKGNRKTLGYSPENRFHGQVQSV
jgi:hypothetical protein